MQVVVRKGLRKGRGLRDGTLSFAEVGFQKQQSVHMLSEAYVCMALGQVLCGILAGLQMLG